MLDLEEGVVTLGSDGVGAGAGNSGQLGAGGQVVLRCAKAEDHCVCIVVGGLSGVEYQLDLGDLSGQCGLIEQDGSLSVLVAHLDAAAVVADLSQIQLDTLNSCCTGVVGLVSQCQSIYGQFQNTVAGCGRSYRRRLRIGTGTGFGALGYGCKPSNELAHTDEGSILNTVSLRCADGPICAVGTQVPFGTDAGGLDILELSIQFVNAGSCVFLQSLQDHIGLSGICISGDHIQVSLGATVHKVDVVASSCCLQIYIDHTGDFLGSAVVVAAHFTGEAQVLAQTSLVHNELIGSTGNGSIHIGDGLGGFLGSYRRCLRIIRSLALQCEPSGKLAHTNERGIRNAVSLRCADGLVGAVGTQVPFSANAGGLDILVLSVQLVNAGCCILCQGLQDHIGLSCIVISGNDVQIGLGVAIHKVDVVATGGFFQIHIDHISDLFAGAVVVTAHLAGEAQLQAQTGLVQYELIGSANYRSIHIVNGYIGSFGSFRCSAGLFHILNNKLGLAHIGSTQEAQLGSADCIIVGVCTQSAVHTVCTHKVYLILRVVVPVCSRLSDDCRTLLCVAADLNAVDLNILLGLALQEVEASALTLGLLCEDLHSFRRIVSGLQVAAAGDLTVQVQILVQSSLLHFRIVLLAFFNGAQFHCQLAVASLAVGHCGLGVFQNTVVVLDLSGNRNGIADFNLLDILTGHTVTLDACAGDLDGNGDILILAVIGSIHGEDLAGQNCNVRQLFTGFQLLGIPQDLILIVGGLLRSVTAADTLNQLAAGIKFDGAIVVLDDTGNGDGILNCDILNAGALQAVAEDGVFLVAIHSEDDGNVVVCRIKRRINGCNLTGQSDRIRQALAVLELVGSLQNLTGVGGSHNGIALFNGLQHTAGIKFNGAIVVLQSTGNSDDVTNCQRLNTFALQAVANNGHILSALNNNGDSNILVLRVVNCDNRLNLATQSGYIRQAFARFQCVGFLNNRSHIHCSRQQAIPGSGSCVALLIGNGSCQHIGSVSFALLVDIHSNGCTVLADNDLDLLFRQVGGPYDGKGNTTNADHSHTVVVHRSFQDFLLLRIECLQVLYGILSSDYIFAQCCLSFGGGCRCFLLVTAGKHSDNHSKQEHPCKYFFHSKLLISFLYLFYTIVISLAERTLI